MHCPSPNLLDQYHYSSSKKHATDQSMSSPSDSTGPGGGGEPAATRIGSEILVAAVIFFFMVVALAFFFYLYARRQLRLYRARHGAGSASGSGSVSTSVPVPVPALGKGLDATVLNSLPVPVFWAMDFEEAIECAVCLSDLADGDTARLLPGCGHWFHLECVDTWLRSHSTCPLCRSAIRGGSSANPDVAGARSTQTAPPQQAAVAPTTGEESLAIEIPRRVAVEEAASMSPGSERGSALRRLWGHGRWSWSARAQGGDVERGMDVGGTATGAASSANGGGKQ